MMQSEWRSDGVIALCTLAGFQQMFERYTYLPGYNWIIEKKKKKKNNKRKDKKKRELLTVKKRMKYLSLEFLNIFIVFSI